MFRSGFVSIVGKPNVGKSTLMNRLVGESLSIVTAKAQTTRHRIMGILTGADYQVVYSDTPGLLEPTYPLQEAMMNFVTVSLEDADLVLFVVEWGEKFDPQLHGRVLKTQAPILVVVNKSDLGSPGSEKEKQEYWNKAVGAKKVLCVSAKTGQHVGQILPEIIGALPEHPAYYPSDELTDRSERFFASEIIREKVFLNYSQEIPYSTEVGIESFKDEPTLLRISAVLYTERDSQKGILIGKAGASLKKVGTQARIDMEAFFRKKVFLEMRVKVAADWRKQKLKLKHFGYLE
ncbi:MAG: GTPase Era [Cyclobacteriaceae bacterium]|jgi:GTP-binding protein Era